MRAHAGDDVARFWASVAKGDGCWLWTRSLNPNGYGVFQVGGQQKLAHRYSLELATGTELPKGVFACHHCDNPPCVRPDHLFAGSNRDNMLDAMKKGRWSPPPIQHGGSLGRKKEVCVRGHSMSGDNVKLWPSEPGKRRCLKCLRITYNAKDRRRRGKAKAGIDARTASRRGAPTDRKPREN